MTATQAPTPGPLSVGNLHTAIMEALAEDIQRQRPDAFREEDENGFEGDVIIPTGATPQSAFAKVNVSDLAEAILPLVAPTAPVEASGSEPVDLLDLDNIAESLSRVGRIADGNTLIAAAVELGRHRNAHHPQPSGETREQVARIIDPAAFLFSPDELPKGSRAQFDAFDRTDRILALIRPAPSPREASTASGRQANE